MATIDTTRDSLTIVKKFTYRGSDEVYSNTYFMSGTTPASPSSWKALADAVITAEKTCWPSSQHAVKAIGHVAGESIAVWSWDYDAAGTAVAGTLSATGRAFHAGDSAMWVRWPTDQLTSRGKPIYLRTYFHPAVTDAGVPDAISTGVKTALETYAESWVTGFADGDAVSHHRAGPHGVAGLTGAVAGLWATTRTLERRGKRP